MKLAIQKISLLLAMTAFLFIVLIQYDFAAPFEIREFLFLVLKAVIGASFFWIGGIIVGDIVVKGVVDEIDISTINPMEGGLEQRISDLKQKEKISIVERQFTLNSQPKESEKQVKNK